MTFCNFTLPQNSLSFLLSAFFLLIVAMYLAKAGPIFASMLLSFFLPPANLINTDEHEGVMRFTFGDKDEMGPTQWKRTKPAASALTTKGWAGKLHGTNTKLYEKNQCKYNWMSPINIQTKRVAAPDLGKLATKEDTYPETLIIELNEEPVETQEWEFGHPNDKYNGIEIRPKNAGLMFAMDNFDPIDRTDPSSTYDFHWVTVHYCDFSKVSGKRTMHQIDGKKFPLELHFMFIRDEKHKPALQQEEQTLDGVHRENEGEDEDEKETVIVAVMGEVNDTINNTYFQPVADAAKKFRGRNFDVEADDDTANVIIPTPWSPTWLLPDNSGYYYYDGGSFPVPPCWKIGRYYILKERIKISQEQLDALTNIHTTREKGTGNTLYCTYSYLQHEILPGQVTQNLFEYDLRGEDNKPRTIEEAQKWAKKTQKMRYFRKKLAGRIVRLDLEHARAGGGDHEVEGNHTESDDNDKATVKMSSYVVLVFFISFNIILQ